MADLYRATLLPMIKCSSCGVDIEISQLADHVCAPPPSKTDGRNAPKLDRAATLGGAAFSEKASNPLRPGRMPPPSRINPSAANKPFRPQNPYSPISSDNGPHSASPLSPPGARQEFKVNRSATSPMPRPKGLPSPDIPFNMDCAFPPWPASGNTTPVNNKPKHGEPTYRHPYPRADPLYAPLSPRTNGGENVARRVDTIAPGPFDGRGGDRRPSTSDGRRAPENRMPEDRAPQIQHRRTATQSSTRSNPTELNERNSLASSVSRSSTFSNRSLGLPANPRSGMGAMGIRQSPPRPPPPPTEPKAEGIDAFLSRLQKETMQPSQLGENSRSRTFPLRQESRDAVEAPPRGGRPSETSGFSRRPTHPVDLSGSRNGLPIRSANRGGPYQDDALALPPMPNYGKGAPLNPLHTPSDSGLSDDSVSSGGFRSVASSRSSPPASEASGQHSRNVSKMGRTEYTSEDPIPRVESPESFMDPRTPPKPKQYNGLVGYNRGKAPEPILQPPSVPFFDAPESPLDPAIQLGLLYQDRSSEPQNSNSADAPTNSQHNPPPRMQGPDTRQRPDRRPTAASRGQCRGCSESIVGKSVKDSSGRLTGRYHKQCFVCRTCRSPFPSAEFYVFDNSPYCEHHYHELNGSLCRACNRGIEGQYLETDQQRKFHPRCFTCLTCRVVLRDDYYEVGGKAYCERHAYAVQKSISSLAPGNPRFPTNNLQKRRTRLMMMI